MNILYIHQHFTLPSGSSGTRSYEAAIRMLQKGHKVTMLCGSFGAGKTGLTGKFKNGFRTGLVDGIEIIELELRYHNKDQFLKRVWTFFKFALTAIFVVATRKKPDLIYATSTPLTVAVPALFAKWVRGVPYIFEVRDLWPEVPVAMGLINHSLAIAVLKWLETRAYNHAVACVGLSPGMVDGITRELTSDKQVTLIPNGCDLGLFSSSVDRYGAKYRDTSVYAAFSALDPQCCNLVFAGTLGYANGLGALVEAVAHLPEDIKKQLQIHLIGDGNQKSHLQTLVRDSLLDDVILFHEPISKSSLSEILGLFDAGILTLKDIPEFQYGTSPNKFFDYIAAGLPVLNNYPGWVADMIEETQCGYYSDSGSAQSFAEIIERFVRLKDDEKIRFSKNAQQLAMLFDRNVLANQQISLCENCVRPA